MKPPDHLRRARRCRGCGILLLAHQDCESCATTTVHVITELGATDGPGLLVAARLLGRRPRGGQPFEYYFTRESPA